MAAKRKSAVEKRDQSPPPLIIELKEYKHKLYPPGAMLIASPLEIGKIVAQIPAGFVVTLTHLREVLAAKFHADYTCAMTTGIFLRILAEAAEEEGPSAVASCPYWRAVRSDGRLIDKLPGGEAAQADRLRREGVACKQAGKNGWKVADLPAHMWRG